jgi:hypothetical protein
VVPTDLYDRHRLLDSRDNPFDRLEGRTPRIVTESLYIKERSRPLASEERPHDQSTPAEVDANFVRVVRKGAPRARLCEPDESRVEGEIGRRTQEGVVPGGAQVQERLDPNDVMVRLPAMLRLLCKRLTND